MTFASLNEFFAMGGHGLYVWAAWGVTALLMLGILLHARLERRQLIKGVKRRMRREKAQRTASPTALRLRRTRLTLLKGMFAMTPKRKQKLFIFLGLVSLTAIAVGLTLYALRANINLFFSPVQIAQGMPLWTARFVPVAWSEKARYCVTPTAST